MDVPQPEGRTATLDMKQGESEPRTPRTVEQLTQRNVEKISQLEAATKLTTSLADKISERINKFCGSMSFVYLHVTWYGIWIGLNTLLPLRFRFDSYPFSFLTLVVSLEAIFLSAFIMISQNRQGILSERRTQFDVQINMLSEQENTKMLCLLREIADKLGIEHGTDHEIELLAKAVQPEQLIQQIVASENLTNEPQKQ